jgi:carbonic anhydrase
MRASPASRGDNLRIRIDRNERQRMDIIYRYDPFAEISSQPATSPETAQALLEQGHVRYRNIVTQVQRELAGKSNSGHIIIPADALRLGVPRLTGEAPIQVPYALALGCSDARAPIEQIFDQAPNQLFVIRVAGNVLGAECLGSIDYAVRHLGQSLKLLFVLGHTGCGAVTAAVDSYLAPKDYADISFTHSLRSLVDRIQIAVRGAAHALEQVNGAFIASHPHYRAALLEVAVYLNAAITAYDVRREVESTHSGDTQVVYGVFDLVSQRVQALPGSPSAAASTFGDVPAGAEGFSSLGLRLAKAVLGELDGLT